MTKRALPALIATFAAAFVLSSCTRSTDPPTAGGDAQTVDAPAVNGSAASGDRELRGIDHAVDPGLSVAALPAPQQDDSGAVALVHRREIELADMETPKARLGARLFRENRFSNPGSQYVASCQSCHKPQDAPDGARAYADRLALSLVPATGDDMKTTTLRNTPTLLDAALGTRFNHDGGDESLEDVIKSELLGRHFGWLPDQREQALHELHALILNDTGEGTSNDGRPYLAEFQGAFGADLSQSTSEEVVAAIVTALADYVRLLKTPETSPYDALAYLNRLGTKIEMGETPSDFSGRLFGRLANIEGRDQVKFPQGVDEIVYQGFKIFMRTYPGENQSGQIGNCVACHHPPKFSDFQFHNTGVAQMEYDAVHGEGAFGRLEIPGPDAERPVPDFGLLPDAGAPEAADLGHWNYVDLAALSDQEGNASASQLLSSMVGAFKTPPLRNLDLTDPYQHNGQYKTLEEVIQQKIQASRMAKEGTLRSADPALLNMDISEEDVAPLAAFLRSLQEVDAAHFRSVVVENTRIRSAD